jgi:septal ring factor EnvC (AmiA/AmiB activator)
MEDEILLGLFDSLKNEVKQEIQSVKDELRPMKDAVQRMEARLDRQGTFLQTGARQVSRLAVWTEDIDAMIADRDGRIEALETSVSVLKTRLKRLENGK